MTIHIVSDSRDDVDRLYMSRKEGGRGLDSVDASIQRLEDYRKQYRGRKIMATRNITDNTSFNRRVIRKLKWCEKQLYGHFARQTSEISLEKTWKWLRKENLKIESESLLIAVQNNAIRTKYVKAKVYKTQQINRCRLCGDRDETINLIISKLSRDGSRRRGGGNDTPPPLN